MTIEENSIDQATSSRRERLKALRAAKEYACMPDVNGDENQNSGPNVEFMADVHEEKKVEAFEEESIEQAVVIRRERLMALRTTNELLSMPEDGPNNSNGEVENTKEAEEHNEFENFEKDSIEQTAATRRERLMALRTAKVLLSVPDDDPSNSNGKVEDTEEAKEHKEPNMKFRNYLPHDKHLQEGKLAPVDLPKFEDPIVPVQRPSDKSEDPFVNIAPKKPNWDLRRDVQKKLEKLERRTQKALYELMLEQEKEKAAMELDGNEA